LEIEHLLPKGEDAEEEELEEEKVFYGVEMQVMDVIVGFFTSIIQDPSVQAGDDDCLPRCVWYSS
jgi:hypothetical protein